MNHRDERLDFVRGFSALAVLAAHARGFLFIDATELLSPSLATKTFYFSTGVHHQAVMVFFVLSGYFVGGGILNALSKERFTWARYALARLSRLWVVLIPALLLTAVCDTIGRAISPAAYSGAWREIWMSGPEAGQEATLSPTTFIGNLTFLQTIRLPVYGSNGPLWSLANEFWYYFVFPLFAVGALGIKKREAFSLPKVLLFLGLGTCILWWLPVGLSAKGLIWLFGVGVWYFGQRFVAQGWRRVAMHLCGAATFAGTLLMSKTSSQLGSDFSIGLAFAIWMLFLLGPWPKCWAFLRPLGRGLSEISYTLYVTHFPLLFLFAAIVLKGRQFEPGPTGFALFLILLIGCLVVAAGLWWLIERRTNEVRRWVSRKLGL